MSTVGPWHTVGGDFYHIRDDCKYYPSVTPSAAIPGTAQRQTCMECIEALVSEQRRDRIVTLLERLVNSLESTSNLTDSGG